MQESELSQEMKSPTWMYDWMKELKKYDSWMKSAALVKEPSQVFELRDSKVHLVKRIRDKLHRLQTTMVRFPAIDMI